MIGFFINLLFCDEKIMGGADQHAVYVGVFIH
jgi:hypothetical protein